MGGTDEPRIATLMELLWLFGKAVPREIKRNALVYLEKKHRPKTLTKEIWKLLFRTRLNDMRNWALQVEGNQIITYKFLSKLQESVDQFDDNNDESDEFNVKSFVEEWVGIFCEMIPVDNRANTTTANSISASYGDNNHNTLSDIQEIETLPIGIWPGYY